MMELNDQQIKAATYQGEAKNILVPAGAGCGKTRTITARTVSLIQLGCDASKILMMTFTNRAAREMKARLKSEIGPVSNQVHAGTFHSFCLKAMSNVPKSFGVSGLNIIDSDDQKSLMTIVRNKYISKNEKDLNKEFPRAIELIKYYSYSRNTCQDPKKYLSKNTDLNEHFISLCSNIFAEYQKAKIQRGYLDYDDLLEQFTIALEKKPKLKTVITKLFDEVLVDEMQDTNPLQFRILRHFSDEGVRLFCVGDPAQSIYRFRGAEFEHVYKFEEIFSNSITIPLSLNYRSYQEILDFSNWLLGRSPLDYPNTLEAHRKSCGYLPMLVDFDSVQDEASWIADKILERRDADIDYKDVMVLVRSGYDAKPIEAEFIQREIPYYFIGGTSLTKSAHVRDVLALLRCVRNQQDDLAWMRFLKLWPRIGDKTAERIVESFNEGGEQEPVQLLSKAIGTNHNGVLAYQQTYSNQDNTKNCVSSAVDCLSPILQDRYDRWHQRAQDLKLLVTVAEKYKSISDFIDAFTLEPMTSSEIEKLENSDAVLLITVHSAKGTEAPICFVASAKQGSYPHSRSYGDINSEEEERRVLYVAFTRAKNELFVTRSFDNNRGFNILNKPTEGEIYFLEDVPDDLVEHEIHGFNPFVSGGLASLEDVY